MLTAHRLTERHTSVATQKPTSLINANLFNFDKTVWRALRVFISPTSCWSDTRRHHRFGVRRKCQVVRNEMQFKIKIFFHSRINVAPNSLREICIIHCSSEHRRALWKSFIFNGTCSRADSCSEVFIDSILCIQRNWWDQVKDEQIASTRIIESTFPCIFAEVSLRLHQLLERPKCESINSHAQN